MEQTILQPTNLLEDDVRQLRWIILQYAGLNQRENALVFALRASSGPTFIWAVGFTAGYVRPCDCKIAYARMAVWQALPCDYAKYIAQLVLGHLEIQIKKYKVACDAGSEYHVKRALRALPNSVMLREMCDVPPTCDMLMTYACVIKQRSTALLQILLDGMTFNPPLAPYAHRLSRSYIAKAARDMMYSPHWRDRWELVHGSAWIFKQTACNERDVIEEATGMTWGAFAERTHAFDAFMFAKTHIHRKRNDEPVVNDPRHNVDRLGYPYPLRHDQRIIGDRSFQPRLRRVGSKYGHRTHRYEQM